MNKRRLFALVLIAACVQVYHASDSGSTTVHFLSYSEELRTSIALLSFTGIGALIGVLLK